MNKNSKAGVTVWRIKFESQGHLLAYLHSVESNKKKK
jgi:hypothetical protein